jgi:hypothetical protein
MTVVSTCNEYSGCNILHELVPAFYFMITKQFDRHNKEH